MRETIVMSSSLLHLRGQAFTASGSLLSYLKNIERALRQESTFVTSPYVILIHGASGPEFETPWMG